MPTRASRPRPALLREAATWSWTFLLVVAALTVSGLVLLRLRLVVVPIVVALLATTLLAPLVDWLARGRLPRLVATWAVFLGAAAMLVLVGIPTARSVAGQFDAVAANVGQGVDDIRDWLADGPLGLSRDEIGGYVETFTDEVRNSGALRSGVLSGAVLAAEVVTGGLLAIVLSFFFVKDGPRMSQWLLDHVPEDNRALVAALGRRAWTTLSGYVRGCAVVGAVDAVGIGLGLVVIGVPLVVPLMILTFMGAFFPIVGATVAGLIAALVALVNGGPVDALLVVAVVLVVQQVEGNVLEPLVMGKILRLHPTVILVALTAGSTLAGLLGAFLAVPVTAVVAATANEHRRHQSRRQVIVPVDGSRRKPAEQEPLRAATGGDPAT